MQEDGNKKTEEKRSRTLYLAGIILLIIVIIIFGGLMIPRLFGVKEYAVASGSMSPEIPVGSLVFVSRTTPETLEAGDIIAYLSDKGTSDIPVVHRVTENDISKGEVHTKGDANPDEDLFPVSYAQIVGEVTFHIPVIGYIFTLGK